MKRKVIYGCEARGDGDSAYLTRWELFACRWGAVYVHKFHRSDAADLHDHPWAFVSLILWRGYVEETQAFPSRAVPRSAFEARVRAITRRRKWPGMLLFRRARHAHRVELVDGKPAWSLMIRGPYVREWGFFTPGGWQQWRAYFTEKGC